VELGPNAVIHLGTDLDLAALAVTSAFWAHDPTDRPQLAEGRILSGFESPATTWPYWERHPTGDELVYLLSGAVDFDLEDGEERRTITLGLGHAAMVPAGIWHRAVIHAPSRILFVTPTPARTQQRPGDC